MAVTPRKKVPAPTSSQSRAKRLSRAPVDRALPANAFPTTREMEELGQFADRVAAGRERLKYIKL